MSFTSPYRVTGFCGAVVPRVAAITGHRQVTHKDTLRIFNAMRGLVANTNVDAIYFGGALGADTEALKAALEIRALSGKDTPSLGVVVPDVLESQPLATHEWSRKADRIIELQNPLHLKSSYKTRNQYLVDNCAFLVGFWRAEDYKSGTYQTLQMASKSGKPVYVIPMELT